MCVLPTAVTISAGISSYLKLEKKEKKQKIPKNYYGANFLIFFFDFRSLVPYTTIVTRET